MAEKNQETPPMAEEFEQTPKKNNTRKKKALTHSLLHITETDISKIVTVSILDEKENSKTKDKVVEIAKSIKLDESTVTSDICRAVNVLFSENFIEEFKNVYDRKSSLDHETSNTYEEFWKRVTAAYNSSVNNNIDLTDNDDGTTVAQSLITQDFAKFEDHDNKLKQHINNLQIDFDNIDSTTASSIDNQSFLTQDSKYMEDCKPKAKNFEFDLDNSISEVFDVNDDYTMIVNASNNIFLQKELVNDKEIDLLLVNRLTVDAFRKKILDLFKIRCRMKDKMTMSETHDKNEYNFVEAAMKGVHGFTKISVFYFFMRCEEVTDIDCNFITFMDKGIKADSTTRDATSIVSSENKKRVLLNKEIDSWHCCPIHKKRLTLLPKGS
jgi:hypothetical protein